ncbi:Zn(II)2Cys6 transcription factor [Phanerochaete sordida]|uniref:Zn(II)2Cys6 transcription factor n=1 Tax=Phanerochaete sordida TaxID=48140 RepID=A0A9P3GAS5_9APHY|nr:Zn(II)2Cys6 transcription factor [Phanerochaete sordida]
MLSSPTSTLTLERGKACLRCRRRKMRCDGGKPVCTQCIKAEIAVDCEYSDGGPTTSQILERNIAELEARINEILKGPPSDSVSLQKPYESSRKSKSPKTPKARTKMEDLLPTPPPPSPGLSPVTPQSPGQTSIPKSPHSLPWPDSTETDLPLETFFAVAPHLGFFFHVPRFSERLQASMPPSPTSPVPPALVFAVILVGCVFTGSADRKFLEPQLLALALQSLSNNLCPDKIMYTLQAEVLIALYLLHQNRRLAASYHVSAAVSIAVACNLHKIRSAGSFVDAQAAIVLPPPADEIEEGERIRAFWTVYILDRGWTLWTHSSSAMLDESTLRTRIDTPWPLEMHNYEQLPMLTAPSSAQTVQLFLKYAGTASEAGQSILTLRVKASIFLDKTARLCVTNDYATLRALNARMQAWALVLPQLSSVPAARPELARGLLTVRTMCACANILTHSVLPSPGGACGPLNDSVAAAALEAASLLSQVDLSTLQFVDIVCGILWGIVGKTLAALLSGLGQGWTTSHDPMLIVASLDMVMSTLQLFGAKCPLIQWELTRLQDRLATE